MHEPLLARTAAALDAAALPMPSCAHLRDVAGVDSQRRRLGEHLVTACSQPASRGCSTHTLSQRAGMDGAAWQQRGLGMTRQRAGLAPTIEVPLRLRHWHAQQLAQKVLAAHVVPAALLHSAAARAGQAGSSGAAWTMHSTWRLQPAWRCRVGRAPWTSCWSSNGLLDWRNTSRSPGPPPHPPWGWGSAACSTPATA